MIINKIFIENYRGISDRQEITLDKFSSIVGKNDSGKSIVLNAITTFLDIGHFPVIDFDFNDPSKPIFFECRFIDKNLRNILEDKIKGTIKKDDGLEEFLNDIIIDNSLILQRTIINAGKKFDNENILINDFDNKDFSMLYSQNDEELNKLLEKYNIIIPTSGKGRNSKLEKIKYIKQFCKENNIPRVIAPIPDEFKVSSVLPAIEIFVSDYGIKADTSFKTNSVSEIKDYFDKETENDTKKLKKVEKEINDEMLIEADSIKNYMLDYTSSLKKIEIVPNIVWKDAIKSVDVKFQLEGDEKPIPMSHKGSGYRRLFMVARFRYIAEKEKGSNVIYLIEEPETFLHPSAQDDLLNSLREISDDNQIVVTTHSPVFAGATELNSVLLCKKNTQSIYENIQIGNENNFIMQIIDELGIKPSYNLRDHHEKIVFVESKNDAKFYDIICHKLLSSDLLNNERILVLPFGGGEDINSFVNINYFDNSQRDLFLIVDSDSHNNNQDKQLNRVNEFNTKEKGKGYMLQKSRIENYYHPKAIERIYSLFPNTIDIFGESEDVIATIKDYKTKLPELNYMKEKNNINVFEETTNEEWKELVEQELIAFLRKILE